MTKPAARVQRPTIAECVSKSQIERLIVDHAQADVQQDGHRAGEQTDVNQLAARADAAQVQDGGGGRAHQQEQFRQALAQGQHDDQRQNAGQQQGEFLPIDDGHGHAEQQQRQNFAAPAIGGSPAGQGHGGDGQQAA